jgi:hypothetical protein
MGIDHAFNFGYFDFEVKNFILNFVRGRMLYFSLAIPIDREFDQYRKENRSIDAQKLALSPAAFARLRDHLLEQVQPQNRDYLYDYYLSNCSTRVRDVLDIALDGQLFRATSKAPAGQNFRDHTRRSVEMDGGYYLGLEAVLGLPVDRPVSRWDEMFLPAVVATALADLDHQGAGVISARHRVFAGDSPLPPDHPTDVWWRYLLLSVLIAGLVTATRKLPNTVFSEGLMLAWLLISSNGGLVLLALWVLTDHQVANPNINLLLLNPLLILALWRFARRFVAILLVAGLVLAGGQWLLPSQQFNIDVLAFVLPLHLLSAWWLWRNGRRMSVS